MHLSRSGISSQLTQGRSKVRRLVNQLSWEPDLRKEILKQGLKKKHRVGFYHYRMDVYKHFQWHLQVYGCTHCAYHERSDPRFASQTFQQLVALCVLYLCQLNSHAINYELISFLHAEFNFYIWISTPNKNRNPCNMHIYHIKLG